MGIQDEISIFVSACLSGVVLCTMYNAIRIFRRLCRHTLFWISVEDLFYWLWAGLYLFSEMQRTCSGRIRWFYVIGILLGGVASGIPIAKFIKNRIDKLTKTR